MIAPLRTTHGNTPTDGPNFVKMGNQLQCTHMLPLNAHHAPQALHMYPWATTLTSHGQI